MIIDFQLDSTPLSCYCTRLINIRNHVIQYLNQVSEYLYQLERSLLNAFMLAYPI